MKRRFPKGTAKSDKILPEMDQFWEENVYLSVSEMDLSENTISTNVSSWRFMLMFVVAEKWIRFGHVLRGSSYFFLGSFVLSRERGRAET